MPKAHTVQQGETCARIARAYKFRRAATVWLDGANKELRDTRANPNVLEPGDVVMIPDRQEKIEEGATGRRHVFVTPRLKEHLVVRCERRRDQPLAEKAYVLTVGGETFEGTTDGKGTTREHEIPFGSTRGKLEIDGHVWELEIGSLNPVSEPTLDDGVCGAQGRLRNLGYYFGAIDGEKRDSFAAALESFEADEELPITGTGDVSPATAARLRKRHGA